MPGLAPWPWHLLPCAAAAQVPSAGGRVGQEPLQQAQRPVLELHGEVERLDVCVHVRCGGQPGRAVGRMEAQHPIHACLHTAHYPSGLLMLHGHRPDPGCVVSGSAAHLPAQPCEQPALHAARFARRRTAGIGGILLHQAPPLPAAGSGSIAAGKSAWAAGRARVRAARGAGQEVACRGGAAASPTPSRCQRSAAC